MTASTLARCVCGAEFPVDLGLPHGRLVSCPDCGRIERVFQAVGRGHRTPTRQTESEWDGAAA